MRDKIKGIQKAVLAAIIAAGIDKEFGVAFEFGNTQYSSDSFTTKLNVNRLTADGQVVTEGERLYREYATSFDLKSEWFGESFRFAGKEYTIRGLKPRAHKYPVTVSIRGRAGLFKVPAEVVRAGMDKKAVVA